MRVALPLTAAVFAVLIAASDVRADTSRLVNGVPRSEFAEFMAGEAKAIGADLARRQVTRAKDELAKVQSARYATKTERAQALAAAKEALAKAEENAQKPAPFLPEMSSASLIIGHVGRLRRPRPEGQPRSESERMTVRQVIDDNNVIITMEVSGKDVWLWLVRPTEGLVDDRDYLTGDILFEVVGTKRYTTVLGGTKTVHQLQRRTLDELLD